MDKNKLHHGWKLRIFMILSILILSICTGLFIMTSIKDTNGVDILSITVVIMIYAILTYFLIIITKKIWWRLSGFKKDSYAYFIELERREHERQFFLHISTNGIDGSLTTNISIQILECEYEVLERITGYRQDIYIKFCRERETTSIDDRDQDVIAFRR